MKEAALWVWACISDFTWWETIAKIAPIGTALIAMSAAIIALCAIRAQRDIAKRRAAIDFFLKTEMDATAIALYDKFKTHTLALTAMPTMTGSAHYRDVRAFLNICELIAIGINKGAFSESVSYAYWGDVIPNSYQTARQLINRIRTTSGEGSPATYAELERLAEKWAKRKASADRG